MWIWDFSWIFLFLALLQFLTFGISLVKSLKHSFILNLFLASATMLDSTFLEIQVSGEETQGNAKACTTSLKILSSQFSQMTAIIDLGKTSLSFLTTLTRFLYLEGFSVWASGRGFYGSKLINHSISV